MHQVAHPHKLGAQFATGVIDPKILAREALLLQQCHGQRIAFAWDPDPARRTDARPAIVELSLRGRRFEVLARDADWGFTTPAYAPDGEALAFRACHRGQKHTMPQQLGLWRREDGAWEVPSATWDHEVQAPLLRWLDRVLSR